MKERRRQGSEPMGSLQWRGAGTREAEAWDRGAGHGPFLKDTLQLVPMFPGSGRCGLSHISGWALSEQGSGPVAGLTC